MKLGALAALGYATALTFQAVLGEEGLASSSVLSVRFGLSGLLLLALCAATGRPLLPARGERLALLALGAVVFMVSTALYFGATEHGSPAVAIVLVYLYPTLVTLAESVHARHRPTRTIVMALVLSTVGCALVALTGSSVTIEPLGVALALAGAATFAAYMFIGVRVGRRSDPVTAGAWVSLGAGASFLAQVVVGPRFAEASGNWPALAAVGLANAVGMGLTFIALRRLGTSRGAVVLTLEAVFTVILSALVLDDTLGPLQVLGAAAVLFAAATVRSPEQAAEPLEPVSV